MLRFRKITLVTTMLSLVLHAFAQGPNNSGTYYQTATGKKGAALKTALYSIISHHRIISYDGLLSYYENKFSCSNRRCHKVGTARARL